MTTRPAESRVPASPRRVVTGNNFNFIASCGRPVRSVVPRIREWMSAEMNRDLAGTGVEAGRASSQSVTACPAWSGVEVEAVA
jgi:hypothetical protein